MNWQKSKNWHIVVIKLLIISYNGQLMILHGKMARSLLIVAEGIVSCLSSSTPSFVLVVNFKNT